ncbi:MAG: alanine dehydrogenase [Bacteroidetes bacterium]|nr:alanine dehydrogenase [Bacteroidota bacterium]
MKIGILREEKTPEDNRVPLTPSQCRTLMEEYSNIWVAVQPSETRCYTDDEYRYQGIAVRENLSDCDLLLGVKEIPPHLLMPNKTYMIFSHTIKKQAHNRKLLRAVLEKKIRLIDYECLKDDKGKRIIAFGRWAGIVGAYNTIRAMGLRTGRFELRPMHECLNFAEAQKEFAKLDLPPWKIVLSGDGRVSEGAAFLLDIMKIRKVDPHSFVYKEFDEVVYTQLHSKDMFYREGHDEFDPLDYHLHPAQYKSSFFPFTRVADVFINGIYWDKRIPVFFDREQMEEKDFNIKIIGDITCDIAPEASVPSTLFASTIAEPFFGYDPETGTQTEAFNGKGVDVMSIDNLPNELPRDASEDFGNMLMSRVIPRLLKEWSTTINKATIAVDGELNEPYLYLSDYVGEIG